jgi:peptidoglycan hydrolase-like protein with peptidoglycan-binding domain
MLSVRALAVRAIAVTMFILVTLGTGLVTSAQPPPARPSSGICQFPGGELGPGASGADVSQLQAWLNGAGASPRLVVDGRFGPHTEGAVQMFQFAQVLGDDGLVGPRTWFRLCDVNYARRLDPTSAVTPPVCEFHGAPVGSGAEGASVRQIQESLNGAGAAPRLAVDGRFGPRTDSAVRTFQSDQGLTDDGLVGPRTWAALCTQSQRGLHSAQQRSPSRPRYGSARRVGTASRPTPMGAREPD